MNQSARQHRHYLRARGVSFFTLAFVAAVVLSVIASHAHAQTRTMDPPVPLTGATLLAVTVTPTGTVFMPGDTVNIIATRGEGSSPLSVQSLIDGFSLQGAELRIEAVALDGSTTTAIQDGIVIGFPDAAYDSVAGDGNGGVTAADGSRLEVDDTTAGREGLGFNSPGSALGLIFPQQDRNDLSGDEAGNGYHATTDYSPNADDPEVNLSNRLGSVHIVKFSIAGTQSAIPIVGQLLQLISAQEISIASTYTGGSFKLRVALTEDTFINFLSFDGTRNSVTVEAMIPVGAPTVPGNGAITAAGVGDTLATLTWTAAVSPITLEAADVQYEATVIETVSGVSSMFTISSGAGGYTLNGAGPMASFTLDRATAVLLPGKPYEVRMRACAGAENCSEREYSGTFQTTSARPDTNEDDIHDELAGVVTPSISRYCSNVDGGDDHADSDGDGVPDNVEVRIGTDCRSGAANDFVGASRPVITISSTGMAVETISGEDYFIHPGTGAMTEVAAGVSCTGCEAGLSAYRDTTGGPDMGTTRLGACIGDSPGQAGRTVGIIVCPPLEVNDGKVTLGSFSRAVLWVAQDAAGNWATQVQRFYIQPRVGFSVSEVRTEGGTAGLPVSVAVSADVEQSFAVEVAPAVGGVSSTVNIEGRRAVVNVQITPTAGTPGEATLSFPSGSQMTAPAPAPDLMNNDLYTLGISTVTVSLLTTPTTTEPAFAFTPQPPIFVGPGTDHADNLTFRIASTPAAAMYEVTAEILQRALSLPTSPSAVTAGQDVVVSFGDNIQPGDIIEVKATGTTADEEDFVGTFFVFGAHVGRGPDDNDNGVPNDDEETGLRTHELSTSGGSRLEVSEGRAVMGGYALTASSVTSTYYADIPDDNPEADAAAGNIGTPDGYPGTGRFDFSVADIAPGGVVSVLIPLLSPVTQTGLRLFKYDNDDGGGWNPFTSTPPDAYYGAPFPCPAISAVRGEGEGEWRAADETGLQAGDGCLLMEITDGGPNDADGTRNGVIYDPNALGGGGDGPGGGGAMDPTWLLLLALAMALSYASRRRQRQFPL